LAGQRIQVLDYGQKLCLIGPRSHLGPRSLPLPLAPEELASVMSGVFAFAPSQVESLGWTVGERPKSSLKVWSDSSPAPIRLTLDGAPGSAEALALRRLSYQTPSGELLEVGYDDYRALQRRDTGETTRFPHRVSAKIGGNRVKRSLEIRYAEVAIGVAPPRDKFVLEPPPGFAQDSL
jgi:hypothetical protein